MLKYKVLGIILCLGFIYNLYGVYERLKVKSEGTWVNVTITNKNIGGGSLTTRWIDFDYNGKQYYRKVGSAYYNELAVGDTLKLKSLRGSKYFLMPTEEPMTRLYISLPLLIVGSFLLIYRFKK
jgi:hypothetical protein